MTTETTLPSPLFDTLGHHVDHLPANTAYPYPSDYQHAADFIYSYRGSLATFNAYRREIERLLQWSMRIAQKPLEALKRQDIEHFIEFCQAPPEQWIGLKKCDRFLAKGSERVPNPAWKPFVVNVSKTAHNEGKRPELKAYTLSQKALQAIFSILGSFFNYLIQQDYMGYNPVSQIRQKSKYLRKEQHSAQIRRLSELQWTYVIETAEKMADSDPGQERTLFIMNALFGMYLRISELSASLRWIPEMGDFFRDIDGNWWFKTVGKGNKARQIAVSDAMLTALKRYRKKQGLSLLPSVGENQPLLFKIKGKGPISSTRQIRHIVQTCFNAAIDRMMQDGFTEDAEQLKSATVHWLRHTGISEDVKVRPREHVRDDAGHGSSVITDHYIDVELRERHASSKKKRIKPED